MLDLQPSLPRRIVCLTEETTETLYLLGVEELIVAYPVLRCARKKRARLNRKLALIWMPTLNRFLLSSLI